MKLDKELVEKWRNKEIWVDFSDTSFEEAAEIMILLVKNNHFNIKQFRRYGYDALAPKAGIKATNQGKSWVQMYSDEVVEGETVIVCAEALIVSDGVQQKEQRTEELEGSISVAIGDAITADSIVFSDKGINPPTLHPSSFNVGESNYAEKAIQPWDIWEEYDLNPWDADILKRILRTKSVPHMTDTESRILDYEKIIHICQHRISKLKK